MALTTRGTGLLETHVEWSEIEEQMQKALHTSATFGPDKSVKNIGEGNGFMSRMSLIDADWQGVEKEENLPKQFIAKICCPLTMMDFSAKVSGFEDMVNALDKMEDGIRIAHNSEVSVYEMFNKYDSEGRIPLTKVYSSRKFSEDNKSKGYILMEYHSNLSPMHLMNNLKPEDLSPVLKSIAIWQAMTFKLSDEDRKMLPEHIYSTLFADAFNEDMNKKLIENMREYFGSHSDLVDKLDEMMPKVIGKAALVALDAFPEALKMKRVICHGDLWSTNMLWSKPDGYKLLAIIDFQTGHFGCAASDLARLMFTSLSGKDRRENWERLLKEFYGYLEEEIEGGMPYTYEQLEEAFLRIIPFAGFFIVPMIGPLMNYLQTKDPEGHETVKQQVMDKMVDIMEDMVKYYGREEKNF